MFTPKITEEVCSHVLLWHPTFFLQYCNVCSMVIPYTSIMTVTTQAITWGPVSIGNCKEQYSLSFSSKNLSRSHERNAPKWFHVQLTNEDFSTSEPSKSTCLQGSFVRIPCCETTGNERPHYPCVPCPTIDWVSTMIMVRRDNELRINWVWGTDKNGATHANT